VSPDLKRRLSAAVGGVIEANEAARAAHNRAADARAWLEQTFGDWTGKVVLEHNGKQILVTRTRDEARLARWSWEEIESTTPRLKPGACG
jgi:hypothetical protein